MTQTEFDLINSKLDTLTEKIDANNQNILLIINYLNEGIESDNDEEENDEMLSFDDL